MPSAKEIFDRTFSEKNTAQAHEENHVSDSDSEKEEERRCKQKRDNKRKRITKSKPRGGKKEASKFPVITRAEMSSVTNKTHPEIMSYNSHFVDEVAKDDLVLAQQRFFEKKNTDYSHVRPVDYPYLKAQLERPPIEGFDMHQINDREKKRAYQQPYSRAFEESRMRPPLGNERQCRHVSECEGLKIKNAGHRAFILVECLSPSELKTYEETGKLPLEVRSCIFCLRKEVLHLWTQIRSNSMGVAQDIILPGHWNFVDVEGEYRKEDTILTSRHIWEGILDPIVKHKRSAYRLIEKNGIPHYEQWRMGYPKRNEEHLFQAPPHPSK